MPSVVDSLVTQETLRDAVAAGETPAWVARHWESFHEALTGSHDGEGFPCLSGAESVANGEPLYTAVSSPTRKESILALRDTLAAYLDCYEDRPGRVSLVAFVRPTDRLEREADYHEAVWHLLQTLHVHDPSPWPSEIPTDPDDPYWEFCFDGEPIFPTCRAPFYEDRQSRYCPVGLEITFQPRGLFEGITAGTPAGERAREEIRGNLEAYDGVCPHANLGDWGVEGDREWHQYLLPADESQAPDEPPATFSRVHPETDPRFDPGVGDTERGPATRAVESE
ncbi:MAG: YqcI/YcgG family protein [Halobaculum sp.]